MQFPTWKPTHLLPTVGCLPCEQELRSLSASAAGTPLAVTPAWICLRPLCGKLVSCILRFSLSRMYGHTVRVKFYELVSGVARATVALNCWHPAALQSRSGPVRVASWRAH
jgi:hypothetical protein